MKISFHMGSPHFREVNTMTFWEIKDESQLETIKSTTENSGLLFNAFRENSYTVTDPEKKYTAHNLTIYLPDYDKNFKSYSNFEYLFKHEKYLIWKEIITAKFPELSDQFPNAEKEAKNRQELYKAKEKLKRYTEETKLYSFHRNDEHIQSLQQRITELRQELYPEIERNIVYKK